MKGLSTGRVAVLTVFSLGMTLGTVIDIQPATAGREPITVAQNRQTNIESRAKQMVEWLGTKQYGKFRANLSPRLQPYWSASKLEQVWTDQVTNFLGNYKKIVKVQTIDAINAKLVVVTTQFEKGARDVIITFSNNGEVVAADFPDSRNVRTLAAAFMNSLVNKDYGAARGYLSPLLKAEVFPSRIQGGWETLLKQNGAVIEVKDIHVKRGSDAENIDVVVVTVQFEKVTEDLILVFDDRKRIVNVNYPID